MTESEQDEVEGGERECECECEGPLALSNDEDTSTTTKEGDATSLATKRDARPSTPASTLFDADFNVTFDAKSGRWLVSNVNVLKR